MAMLWIASCFALVASALGCGVPAIKPVVSGYSKIVNGEDAVSGSWPWQVSLQRSNGFHFCGGSLINEYWILTAAHCTFKARNDHVVLGDHDRSSGDEPTQKLKVHKAIPHPKYGASSLTNDLQLLKLSTPAKFTDRVSPVCVAKTNYPPLTQCVTTGWGRTGSTSSPPVLQQAALPLISNEECYNHWWGKLTDSMMCAGGYSISSCQGDSGGPLVCETSGVWTQVGVVSWGTSTCNPEVPAIYTDVAYMRDWIDQTMARN
ncbi:chymotrypsinogen 2-like [Engraulis encrasicolus]|uniref:chymotrypsinogen 2-like n=1 Tax=Engraulis encrasicolus TaxID=184585 RepID=UPI002FCF1A79